jgi:bacteriorhodopsin
VQSAGKAISWARYADWIITTPLLMVDMCKLAHADAPVTQMLVCLDIVMISLGVASAITHSRVRSLVWFAASAAMYVLMVILIQSELGSSIESESDDVKSLYEIFKMMTLTTWSFYPIVVLVGDQNAFCSCGIISHDAESIALSVLDIIAKVGVEILLVAMKVTSHAAPAVAAAIAINGTVAVQAAAAGAH